MRIRLKMLHTDIEDILETMIVATNVKGDFIGFVQLLYENRQAAWFSNLFVREDHRKRNVGRQLIERCERLARKSSCETLTATVITADVEALGFYRKLGFVIADDNITEGLLITKVL